MDGSDGLAGGKALPRRYHCTDFPPERGPASLPLHPQIHYNSGYDNVTSEKYIKQFFKRHTETAKELMTFLVENQDPFMELLKVPLTGFMPMVARQ